MYLSPMAQLYHADIKWESLSWSRTIELVTEEVLDSDTASSAGKETPLGTNNR